MHVTVRDHQAFLTVLIHDHIAGSAPDADDHGGSGDIEGFVVLQGFVDLEEQAAFFQVQAQPLHALLNIRQALFLQGDDLGFIQPDGHQAFVLRLHGIPALQPKRVLYHAIFSVLLQMNSSLYPQNPHGGRHITGVGAARDHTANGENRAQRNHSP